MIIASIDVAKSDSDYSSVVIAKVVNGTVEIIHTDNCKPNNRKAYEEMINRLNDKYPYVDKILKA